MLNLILAVFLPLINNPEFSFFNDKPLQMAKVSSNENVEFNNDLIREINSELQKTKDLYQEYQQIFQNYQNIRQQYVKKVQYFKQLQLQYLNVQIKLKNLKSRKQQELSYFKATQVALFQFEQQKRKNLSQTYYFYLQNKDTAQNQRRITINFTLKSNKTKYDEYLIIWKKVLLIKRYGGQFNMHPQFQLDYNSYNRKNYQVVATQKKVIKIYFQISIKIKKIKFIFKKIIHSFKLNPSDTYLYLQGSLYSKFYQIIKYTQYRVKLMNKQNFLTYYYNNKGRQQIYDYFTTNRLFALETFSKTDREELLRDEEGDDSDDDDEDVEELLMDDAMKDYYMDQDKEIIEYQKKEEKEIEKNQYVNGQEEIDLLFDNEGVERSLITQEKSAETKNQENENELINEQNDNDQNEGNLITDDLIKDDNKISQKENILDQVNELIGEEQQTEGNGILDSFEQKKDTNGLIDKEEDLKQHQESNLIDSINEQKENNLLNLMDSEPQEETVQNSLLNLEEDERIKKKISKKKIDSLLDSLFEDKDNEPLVVVEEEKPKVNPQNILEVLEKDNKYSIYTDTLKKVNKEETFDVYQEDRIQQDAKTYQELYDQIYDQEEQNDLMITPIDMEGLQIQKVIFTEDLLNKFITTHENFLGLFFERNLKVDYLKKRVLPYNMQEDKEYQFALKNIKQNIVFYFQRKKESFVFLGEYAYWLDMFLTKIKRLGYLQIQDQKECQTILRPLKIFEKKLNLRKRNK